MELNDLELSLTGLSLLHPITTERTRKLSGV